MRCNISARLLGRRVCYAAVPTRQRYRNLRPFKLPQARCLVCFQRRFAAPRLAFASVSRVSGLDWLIHADWKWCIPDVRVDAAGGERGRNCECQMVEYCADGVCHAGAVPVHDAYAL